MTKNVTPVKYKPDIEIDKAFTTSESYIVNIDVTESKEYIEATLTVAKYDGSTLTILNTFNGMDAINMWNELVGSKKL